MAIHVLNFYYKNNKVDVDVVDTDTLEIVDITLYNKIWNFCYQNKDITPCGFYPVNIDEQSDKKFFVLSQAIGTKENCNNIENIFKNEIIQLFKKETPVISELKQPYTLNKYYYFYTNDEVALVKYRLCTGNRILLFDTSKPQS